MRERWVAGNEGLKLYVREWGEPGAVPTMLLVHGYPDTSDIWTQLVERLQDRYHVVAYDVRGAGRSEAGWMYGGYELPHLVGDLAAVVQATAPKGAKVHLVGHDWGSIQGWEAVTTGTISHRIASYTFFGAPCLDHAGHWLRKQARLNPLKLARMTGQLSRSWYIAAFHVPRMIPGLSLIQGAGRSWFTVMRSLEKARKVPGYQRAPTSKEDAKRGVWLYRANFAHKLLQPQEGRTDVPVQAIITTRDLCVQPSLYQEMADRVPNLWRRDLKAGHWIQVTHLDQVASWITEFVDYIEGGPETEALRQAHAQARATPRTPAAHHAVSHPLHVAEVERLTDDSVAVTFAVPDELREQYRFTQGQHLIIRTDLGGQDVRRNYSICAPVSSGRLRIGVRHIPGGVFSAYAMEQLKPGDTLEVMTPSGRFFTPLDPSHAKHYVAVAAGSGITPVLSILTTTLETEPESRFTLLYGNRTRASTMFRAELEALEKRYPGRLRVWHFLSREPQSDPLFSGRIDAERLTKLLATQLPAAEADEWFLCGPQQLVQDVQAVLLDHGVKARHVHLELFHVETTAEPVTAAAWAPSEVTVTVDGQPTSFPWSPETPDTLLDVALATGVDAPYACRDGICGTCRARLLDGTVDMAQNFALDEHEIEDGYVLTCQAHPTSPKVVLDYDA